MFRLKLILKQKLNINLLEEFHLNKSINTLEMETGEESEWNRSG